MENEPHGMIEVGDYEMEVTRRTTRLVRYFAQTAFDHIRIENDESVLYMFRSLMNDPEKFSVLEDFIADSEMPMAFDEQYVTAEVQRAFDVSISQMSHLEGDYIPDDWLS